MEKISINDNNYSTSNTGINTTGWAKSISDFKFMEQIGRGGFSYCHRCIHLETKKEYAVKVNYNFCHKKLQIFKLLIFVLDCG